MLFTEYFKHILERSWEGFQQAKALVRVVHVSFLLTQCSTELMPPPPWQQRDATKGVNTDLLLLMKKHEALSAVSHKSRLWDLLKYSACILHLTIVPACWRYLSWKTIWLPIQSQKLLVSFSRSLCQRLGWCWLLLHCWWCSGNIPYWNWANYSTVFLSRFRLKFFSQYISRLLAGTSRMRERIIHCWSRQYFLHTTSPLFCLLFWSSLNVTCSSRHLFIKSLNVFLVQTVS